MSSLRQILRLRVSLLWFGCAWLLALPAFAQPRIEWQASAGCPNGDEGRAQIARLVRAPLDELAIQLYASVRLRRESGPSFAASIEVQQDGIARTRVLHSADCGVLAHASAVIVALAIDPAARIDEPSAPAEDKLQQGSEATTNPSGSREAAPPAGSGSEATAEPARQAPQSPDAGLPLTAAPAAVASSEDSGVQGSAARDQTSTLPAAEGGKDSAARAFVGAALALNAGSLPKLAPGLAFRAGLDTSWSRLALRLTYSPAQRAAADDLPRLAGRVGLFAAAIEAGLHWYLAQLELTSLAGLEAGVFAARGSEGVYDRQSRHPLWLGSYLGAGLALLLDASFRIGLRFDGIVALRRPSFVLRSDLGGNRMLYRPNVVAGRAWLELELHFAP